MHPPEWIKRLAVRLLPPPLFRAVRRLHYLRVLQRARDDEEPDLAACRHFVSDGDVVVDVGANIGIYTKAFSRWVGPRGTVIAVEPVPETHDVLRKGVERLGLRNVRLVRSAFSDRAGRAMMAIPRMPGDEGHYFAHLVATVAVDDERYRLVQVTTSRMDQDLAPLAREIALIKCDVEGHELDVVQGAARLLDVARPAWLIEVAGDPDASGSPAAELMASMSRLGYGPWYLDQHRLRPRSRGTSSINYFFLTEVHLERLRSRAPHLLDDQVESVG